MRILKGVYKYTQRLVNLNLGQANRQISEVLATKIKYGRQAGK